MNYDEKEFRKIQKQATAVVTNSGTLQTMFQEITEMYWMEDGSAKVNGRDKDDVKLTISPSARNEVIGMVRLLTASAPRYKAVSEKADKDKIEQALMQMVKQSNIIRQVRAETDAARSAVLYSDVHLMVELVDDLLAIESTPDYEKERLREIRKKTPFLITAISPMEGYPVFGAFGLRAYLRKYKAKGADIYERFGVDGLDEEKDYTVFDWYGMRYRVIWLEEQGSEPILFQEHGMKRIPISCKVSDGTNLWKDEERKRQPFLYAKWKGGLWKRENLLLTTLFTSMFERGTGPLASIDPASLPEDGTVTINYEGAFRYIIGRAQLINDKAFDRDLLEANGLLDKISGESTVYKQALGQQLNSGQPFSAFAMAAQSGRLPLVAPQETVSLAFQEIGEIILAWIKAENIQNELLKAIDIPDDLELECELQVKLPQDMFRNAQMAAQLKGIVSKEWIHNLLQVDDSGKMTEQIWTEEAAELFYQAMQQDFMQQAKAAMQAAEQARMQPQQGQGLDTPGSTPGYSTTGQPQPQPGGPMPQGMPMPGKGQAMMPGGPEQVMAGGGVNPLTEPVEPG